MSSDSAADGAGTTEMPEPPPQTGVLEIDEAIARLGDLSDVPLSQHHDHLARAHEALDGALNQGPQPRGGSDDPDVTT